MKKSALVLLCGLLALGLSLNSAAARPQFNTAFKAKYIKPDGSAEEKALAAAFEKAKCNTCHGKNAEEKEDKKVRNAYGEALAKLLTKNDVKNKEKIEKSLEEVAGQKTKEGGPTFGELLKQGKLPE